MTLSNFFALNVDPSKAIPGSYNYTLVLLSYLVATLGSYAFLQFATRIAELRDASLRFGWLALGAFAMAAASGRCTSSACWPTFCRSRSTTMPA